MSGHRRFVCTYVHNNPINHIDPLGLMERHETAQWFGSNNPWLEAPAGPLTYLQGETAGERVFATLNNVIALSVNYPTATTEKGKQLLNQHMGGGAGDAAEMLVAGSPLSVAAATTSLRVVAETATVKAGAAWARMSPKMQAFFAAAKARLQQEMQKLAPRSQSETGAVNLGSKTGKDTPEVVRGSYVHTFDSGKKYIGKGHVTSIKPA